MNRKLTRIGLAPPPQVNRRPSGRYAVRAPEIPNGSIVYVDTGREKILAQVIRVQNGEAHMFVRANREPFTGFRDWEYANEAEVLVFNHIRRVTDYADAADSAGAPAFAAAVKALPDRVEITVAVAEELKIRGKTGKAEQVLAYLKADDVD